MKKKKRNIKNSKKIVPATVFAAIIVLLAFAVMSTTVSANNPLGLLQKEVEGPLTIFENTETQWTLVISVTNTLDYTMENTVITDRFGAEIEIDDPFPYDITHGTVSYTTKGNSDKVFLTWQIGDLLPGEIAQLTLLVSTDLNPAGKQEYSSPGVYEMNSGATLKFNDPEQKQLSAVTDSIYVTVEKNLLTNPGAETGDLSGWTILANGGNGWGIWGVDTTAYAGPYEGNHCFLTSYQWCKRSQEVDLLAKGYTEAQLDAAPSVNVEEWFGQGNPYDRGRYYLNVELRDKDHNVIASWYSGNHWTTWGGSGIASWDQLSHVFSGYGTGLRYIYWEDGGKDENWWAGWYGAKLDAACLIVAD